MAWCGRTAFHSQVTTPIPSDVDIKSLVDHLHNHSFIITMQPIVTRHELRDQDPETGKLTYNVWENIDLLPFGWWKYEIQFTTAFTDKKEGVTTWLEAGLGICSEADYTVRPTGPGEDLNGEGGGWVLDEQIETSCNTLLKWFVEATMLPVRKKMHAQIMEAVKESEKNGERRKDSGDGAAPTDSFIPVRESQH